MFGAWFLVAIVLPIHYKVDLANDDESDVSEWGVSLVMLGVWVLWKLFSFWRDLVQGDV